jgi:hypothetical protein
MRERFVEKEKKNVSTYNQAGNGNDIIELLAADS